MAKLKVSIHPLFFIFGVYFALTGRVFVFLTYTLVAVMHECGHSLVAARLGYRLNKITLMPYGAVIRGDLSGLNARDEISVALAGPITNLCCAVLFVAVWWVYPELYAFTELAVTASLSIAVVNLLPCAPLDGGRVLNALLKLRLGQRRANRIVKWSGLTFSCVLGGLFVVSCFYRANFTIIFFALFALFGTVLTGKSNSYVRIFDGAYMRCIERGAQVKRIAVTPSITVKKIVAMMDDTCLTELAVYEGGTLTCIISPKELCDLVSGDTFYKTVGELLRTPPRIDGTSTIIRENIALPRHKPHPNSP